MNILVTIPQGDVRRTFIPADVEKALNALGSVQWNTSSEQFTTEELVQKIKNVDVCITGWGTKEIDETVLEHADKLKIVAHTGGTVASYVCEKVYERGIKVISGNLLYAESVAEGVIGYILASLRDIPRYNNETHGGGWKKSDFYNEGLLDQTIGLVSYGMIAKCLVKMLKPFRTKIKVYSRHLSDADKKEYGLEQASLEEIFTTCKIISIHSPLTPATYHMIGKELLEMVPDGTLLVNTARGSVIDEEALIQELQKKRFKAALDVYEGEPLPQDSKLRGLDNVLLMPHMGGPTIDRRKYITMHLIEDIKRHMEGKPLQLEISKEYAANMTR